MTFEEKGAYIELLILQFNTQAFSLAKAKKLLGESFEKVWPALAEKFCCKNNLFFNERLEFEKERRKNFIEKQRVNGKNGGRPQKPKPNPNETQAITNIENENLNENKDEILLGKSENLFPKITEVERVFLQQGGTKEMALAFFNRYEAVEWKIRGSTITNYPTLIGTFIINWHKNETHGSHNGSSKSNRDKQTEATGRLLNKLRGITGTGQTSASG